MVNAIIYNLDPAQMREEGYVPLGGLETTTMHIPQHFEPDRRRDTVAVIMTRHEKRTEWLSELGHDPSTFAKYTHLVQLYQKTIKLEEQLKI